MIDITPLHRACQNLNEEIKQLLLNNNANINDGGIIGYKQLMYAIDKCNEKTVRILINKDANVNAKDLLKKTALMIAVNNNKKRIC